MIDDVLRADAQRWNAAQPRVPDLDEAVDRLDCPTGPSRSRRMMLSGLAAASVVAAAAAVVIVSASVGQGRHSVTPASSSSRVLAAGPTHTLLVPVTVIVEVTKTVPVHTTAPEATRTSTYAVNRTDSVRAAESGTDGTPVATVQIQHLQVAPVRAKPVVGHTRALLASIGLFVAIAGAWGIGRAQRRRAH
jgi:hypothetical protein